MAGTEHSFASNILQANPTAEEKAYTLIQDAILTGRLKGGQLLTEQDLEKSTGVSRTPVRAALKRLADQGLVISDTTLRNRKNYVAKLTQEYVEELVSLRSLLESFAARRAAEKITEEEIARLEAIQDQIEKVILEKGRWAADDFAKLNALFHETIWQIGNSHVSQLLSGTLSAPFKMTTIPEEKMLEHLEKASMYHREILTSLKKGDAQTAGIQMQTHIVSAMPFINRAKN